MNAEWVRHICLALPHTTETVQWADDLVFKVGGKMFAVAPLEPGRIHLSFKCTPEGYAELVERPGIIPAPYLARAYWVAIEEASAMPRAEVRQRLEEAHGIVFNSLPKKTRTALSSPPPA